MLTLLFAAQLAAAPDTLESAARRALAAGQPWQASRLLAPLLKDSTVAPATTLLAARAASGWGGSAEVLRLLRGAPWLDRLDAGEGQALLAAAALDARRDTLARDAARAAVRTARGTAARGERSVLLARALDRLDVRDSASQAYRAAADALPLIGDWLLLRAIAVTDDSAARASIGAGVVGSLPRSRLAWAEAQARERQGDSAAAATAWVRAGATLNALGLRLRVPTARDSARRELVALLDRGLAGEEARSAAALLQRAGPLTPAEQRLLAVALERGGELAAAATAYAAALKAGALNPAQRLAYADLLLRLGRYAETVRVLKPLLKDRQLGAAAAYRTARAHLRDGNEALAVRQLQQLPARYPRDTVAASQALYLLGDLATDSRNDAGAIQYWTRLTARYPTAPLAPAARFRTGIAQFAQGDARAAATTFDQLVERHPRSGEALAARYWSGRARRQLGDSTGAAARWREVIAADQRSWYAGLSEERLGITPWRPAIAVDSFAPVPDVDSALARAALLTRLGMDPEAAREVAAIVRGADAAAPVERLLAVAHALRKAQYGMEAITVARRAAARQPDADARTWRLLYPLAFTEALRESAERRGVDPVFAAALIRQESMYAPGVTSRAGARGLMQLMPEVGRLTARSLRYPLWDTALLFQPDVNLELGMTHLAELLQRYAQPVKVLAAYNAGASRVERWSKKAGVEDPELFAERIPFTETRDYVRVIQRNEQFYRVLYDWPPRRAPQP